MMHCCSCTNCAASLQLPLNCLHISAVLVHLRNRCLVFSYSQPDSTHLLANCHPSLSTCPLLGPSAK
ncbi:hypothetical protein AQUCO_02000210v1 [Aquilegia coerulea]|uniref:Uncharacterized protein n=1 Tax=Aquilegia coerulea TaxID=218851 RepID=A0A2G5DGJ6_AQUCA|nr:hypothetical protein AQUCO_02000210v1 [Aquilegia coerulea]